MTRQQIIFGGGTVAAILAIGWGMRAELATAMRPVLISYTESVYSLQQPETPKFVIVETLGVRTDGSVSIARPMLHTGVNSSTPFFIIKIVDRAANRYVVIDQFTQSKTTYPSEQMVAQKTIKPATTCTGVADEPILGFPTIRSEDTKQFPNETFKTTYWYSPQLNCLPLRVEGRIEHSDGRGTLQVRLANSVVIADPPDWMFVIPDSFAERNPTEVLSEASRRKQTKGASYPLPTGLDEVYRQAQGRTSKP